MALHNAQTKGERVRPVEEGKKLWNSNSLGSDIASFGSNQEAASFSEEGRRANLTCETGVKGSVEKDGKGARRCQPSGERASRSRRRNKD